jgi:hypothetical protein
MAVVIAVIGWVLLLGLAVYGFRCGSSRLVCLALGVALAALIAHLLAPLLGEAFHFSFAPSLIAGSGVWQAGIFLLLVLAAVPLAHWLGRLIVFSFEPFEYAVGMTLGLALGLFAAHFFLLAAVHAVQGQPERPAVVRLFLVRQLVAFDSWHGLQRFVASLGQGGRALTYQAPEPEGGEVGIAY